MNPTSIAQEPLPSAQPLQTQIVSVFQELLAQPSSAAPKRGRPPKVTSQHLWLALLLGIFQASGSFREIWRSVVLAPVGRFAPVDIGYQAIRKRLLALGSRPLQDLFESLREVLAQRDRPVDRSALPLASFAREVVALDETTCDKLKRLTSDLHDVPDGDPHRLMGKLAGLFDLRRQQWRCLQLRTDVLAGCNTGVLMLLEGLPAASLILADLGYFSFAWLDYLTDRGYYYISRLRDNGTYLITHVLYEDTQTQVLDAIVWLGAYRADRAKHAVRLVQWQRNGIRYQYLTHVLDPLQLPLWEIAHLYGRRWDIELMFQLLKRDLGLHIWWAARQELVEIQLWIALLLAQILCAVRFDLAEQAQVELFDVSLSLLIKVLGRLPDSCKPLLQRLVEHGRQWGIIRPHRRIQVCVPALLPERSRPLPPDTPLLQIPRYAGRNPHPRKQAFVPRHQDRFIIAPP